MSLDRDSFVFYRSFYEALQNVPKKNRAEVYEAVFAYVFESSEPSVSGVTRALWELIRPQLDASQKRYENSMKGAEYGKKGAEYGKLGGRPKKEKTPLKGDIEKPPKRGKDQNPLNVNVNENVNVNDNVNVNVSDPDKQTDTHTERGSDTQNNRPSNIEIARTILEEGYVMDAASIQRFVEYNDKHGWKMDWQLALKRWAEREKPPDRKPKRNKFNNFERNRDNDELAKKIIQMQLGGNA